MGSTLYTAIVFISGREWPVKYRKITNMNRFMIFAISKYPLLTSVNFYDKETKKFIQQLKP